ncbi:MAG: InlB B-repeat-containing protein [Lentimicrobiaceae bacterium]|nr:InlB B-repeat-containing protein [Lentimicrobiaceae bacterium]
MTKTIFKILFLSTLLLIGVINTNGQTWPPAGMQGDGLTAETAWEITTLSHLFALSNHVNDFDNQTSGKYYKLMNDIDMSGISFIPIGGMQFEWTYTYTAFRGNFDGNGKVIKNLTINSSSDRVGLFGHVASNATFQNLGLENVNITGGQYIGGLIGTVGAMRGQATTTGNITISNCYVTGKVTGTQSVGGLVGYVAPNSTCNITNCYTECNVTANNFVGGLVGDSRGDISYCYTTGTVKGNGTEYINAVGGVIGRYLSGTVKNVVAANDTVINYGIGIVGRVIGSNQGTTPLNCYGLTTMVIANNNGVNGTNATITQLQSQSFYTTPSNWNTSPWNFTTIWTICNAKSFPYFQHQNKPCQYTITPSATAGGTISPNTPQSVPVNGNITFTATPTGNCKEVDVWKIDNTVVQTGGNTYTIQNVQSDQTISVSFKTIIYTLTPLPATNGTISPNTPQTVECDGSLTTTSFYATPNTNYEVDKWYVDDVPVQNGGNSFVFYNWTLTANHTIEVTFKYVPPTYTVTFASNGGNGNMTPQTFTEGVPQSLSQNQFYRNGYDFKNWNTSANGNGTTYQNGQTITVSANMTLFAQWETTHIPVTNITNVPTTATANVPLTLTGTVVPSNATYKTIVWTVKSAGTTGAKIVGNVFTATSSGTATITATIQNGISMGVPYTKDFTITVNTDFVKVTDITNVPTSATANVPLTLTATVLPTNATNQSIIWTVKSQGTTSATINGNTFLATSSGTATITATIQNGVAVGTPFTKDFNIKVDTVVGIAENTLINFRVYPNPTTDYITIDNETNFTQMAIIYDIRGSIVISAIISPFDKTKVNMGHLSVGMYVLRVGNETMKILKE